MKPLNRPIIFRRSWTARRSEKLEAEIAAKDTIEEKFAMLCEDLSQQAQQATEEAERLQAELTAAKESHEASEQADHLQAELIGGEGKTRG